ncbi:MAG: hypothetical protein ACM3QS_07230 [Bacteroidota bacterium]
MKGRIFAFVLTLLTLLALPACSASTGTGSTPGISLTGAVAQDTFSDPFAYCAAVGQVDAPDSRYTGPQMSDILFKDYLKAAGLDPNGDYPEAFKKMTVWRCMGGKLYACNFGANIPCDSKASTDKTPTQTMTDYCRQFPDNDFIPMSVTGHNVIYSWRCVKGVPEILKQIDTVDAAGYQSSFWLWVQPLP